MPSVKIVDFPAQVSGCPLERRNAEGVGVATIDP
jgi:hypothetical protein